MQHFNVCKVGAICRTEPKLIQIIRIMKLTALIMVLGCIHVSAKGFTQTVSLSVKEIPLEKVFSTIEKQSGFFFIYNKEQISNAHSVTVQLKDARLEEVLNACFKDQPFTYSIVNTLIVVKEKNKSVSINSEYEIQLSDTVINVKGKVVNEKGEPVEGVTVNVKGTSKATVTDTDGEFALNVDKDAVLVFSHVSMETFEVKVNGKTDLAIHLKTKLRALGDVQVVANTGYQTVKPNEVTGSITVLNTKVINQQVGTNILSRLDGVSSGVLFPKQKLQDGPNFMVRGLSTINGPKNPLIVVDNFPYDGDINNINPNDVESITILKDAAAASIWGARAGNGVIVITTKKGKINQPLKIGLNSDIIISEKPELSSLRIISSSDYINLETFLFDNGYYDSYLNNSSSYPAVSPIIEILDKRKAGLITSADSTAQFDNYKNIDARDQFSKYMYENGVTQQYALNLSGGNRNIAYYLSAGYNKILDQLHAVSDRYTFRSENTYTPLKNLFISLGVQYTQSQSSNGKPGYGSVSINQQWQLPYLQFADNFGNPLSVAKNYRDSYTDTAGVGQLLNWKYFPLDDWKHNTTKNNQQDLLANIGLNYKLQNGLGFEIKYMYERQNLDSKNLQDLQSYDARDVINTFSLLDRSSGNITYQVPLGGVLNVSNSTLESQNFRTQIDYSKSWHKHSITALAGAEVRQSHTTGSINRIYGYNDNTLVSANVDLVNSYPTFINGGYRNIPGGLSLNDQLNRFVSVFGNAAYTYKNKYTLSLSIRRDASNLFGVNINNKWNPLYSVGGSWAVSNESFYKFDLLPYIKIRATVGYSGNTDPSRTGVLTLVLSNPLPISNLPSSRVNQFPNPDLRWEKVKMINVGVDFQSARQIITGTFEGYLKRGIDLYGAAPFDPTAGLNGQSSLVRNVANMKGSGFDVTINSQNLEKIIKWNSSLLFSYNVNKTTSYFVDSNSRSSSFINTGFLISPVLYKPLYSIVAFRWAGLDATGNPQGYSGKDISTDYSTITQQTKKEDLIYKTALPKFFGNLINTFSWKGFGLTVNISYKLGYYFLKPTISYSQLFGGGAYIGSSDYTNRWQHPGDEKFTNIPSFVYPANNNRDIFFTYSEINILKADNVKLQYINLSYDFDKKLFDKLPIQQLQIYINASNLGVLWKANKENIDPDYISSPIPGKIYAVGIRANF